MEIKTRAIYIPDLRFDKTLLFDLVGDRFICTTDARISYLVNEVIGDNNWLIITIDTKKSEVINVRK